MRTDGVLERVAAVRLAISSARFQERLNAADLVAGGDVSALALQTLDALAVDHRGVSLAFRWEPDARKLTVHVRPGRGPARS